MYPETSYIVFRHFCACCIVLTMIPASDPKQSCIIIYGNLLFLLTFFSVFDVFWMWDVRTGDHESTFQGTGMAEVTGICVHTNRYGVKLFTASRDGYVRQWNVGHKVNDKDSVR